MKNAAEKADDHSDKKPVEKNLPGEIQRGKLGFMWFAIIAFALMLAVWLALFIVAAKNKVQEVPLAPDVGPAARVTIPETRAPLPRHA